MGSSAEQRLIRLKTCIYVSLIKKERSLAIVSFNNADLAVVTHRDSFFVLSHLIPVTI